MKTHVLIYNIPECKIILFLFLTLLLENNPHMDNNGTQGCSWYCSANNMRIKKLKHLTKTNNVRY